MGDHASGARPVHDPAARRGRDLLLLQSRPRRGPVLHHQDDGRERRLARRHRRGDADAGRRQDREEAAGAALSRPRPKLFAAGRLLHPGLSHGYDAARQGEGPLVPGAQEGRRHPGRSACRHHRPQFQRRVRRRLFRHLHADRRRLEPRRPQDAGRGHPPDPAARSRRQQGRYHRRASAEDLHRVQPRKARHARHHPAADLRQRRPAERRGLRRLGRDLGRPHQCARHRRLLRRRGHRRRAGAGRRPCVPARRHRHGQARLRGPADLHRARRRQACDRPRRLDGGRRQHPHPRREPERGDEGHHRRAAGRHRRHPDRRPAAYRRRVGLGIRQDLRRGARHRAGRELPVARLAHRHRRRAVGAAGARDRASRHVRAPGSTSTASRSAR